MGRYTYGAFARTPEGRKQAKIYKEKLIISKKKEFIII